MNLGAIRSLLPGVSLKKHTFYRVVAENFVSTIDDIWPSYDHGWRFNPKNEFGVLYLSISERCCTLERQRQFTHGGKVFQGLIAGEFKVNMKHGLDLTDFSILKKIGIDRELLLSDDFTVPQAVAREARQTGFEALLVPSAASGACQNLVVFKDKLTPPSFCLLTRTFKPEP